MYLSSNRMIIIILLLLSTSYIIDCDGTTDCTTSKEILTLVLEEAGSRVPHLGEVLTPLRIVLIFKARKR